MIKNHTGRQLDQRFRISAMRLQRFFFRGQWS